jgi:acid phosphatase type 7
VGSSYRTIGSGADYYFDTHPVPGTRRPVRFWALGDPGTGTANQRNVRDAFYNYAATNGPADFWLMLGDNAYNSGLDSEYQTAVFNTYPVTLRNKFLWPAIGNHETAQSSTATEFPYLNIFTLPQNGESGGVPSGNPKYYSFDYANIHFICLDSMTSGRNQTNALAQWMQADLSSTTQEWVIAFWHHPPYTRGNHNSDSESELIQIRQNWLPIMEAFGVDLVLCGHSHAWERSYLLNGHYGLSSTLTSAHKIDAGDGRTNGTGAYQKNAVGQGVVYVVAGSAGQITGGTLNHPANFLSLNELGSMVVDVVSNRLEATFLSTNGIARDRFTLVKSQRFPMVLGEVTRASGNIILSFNAYSNVTYTVEGTVALNTTWTPLATIAAATTNRLIELSTPGTNGMSFYRLRSP